MKKLTSIIGKTSLVIVILFSAITSFGKPTGKNTAAVNTPYTPASGTGNVTSNTALWSLVFNGDQQKLYVKQATNAILPANISIANTGGTIIYSGKLSGAAANINMSELRTGKYVVRLQNGNITEEYKLLVL